MQSEYRVRSIFVNKDNNCFKEIIFGDIWEKFESLFVEVEFMIF